MSKYKANEPVVDSFLKNFYELFSVHKDKWKLLELFKQTGKGGIIKVNGDPIFPLKMTLDYLLSTYNESNFIITKTKGLNVESKYGSPVRKAFKESKNFENISKQRANRKIEVEGKIISEKGSSGECTFKHMFEIKNNLIAKLTVCC